TAADYSSWIGRLTLIVARRRLVKMAGENIGPPLATLPSRAQFIAALRCRRRQKAVRQFHRGAREIRRNGIARDGQPRPKSECERRLATPACCNDFGGSAF